MSTTLLHSTLSILERSTARAAARFDRPAPEECDAYYRRYIEKTPPGDFHEMLRRQAKEVADTFGPLTSAQAEFAYAPGKWTLTEVLGHLVDTERIFSYRALHMARQDPSALPGMDQEVWMASADYRGRSMADVLGEWMVVRASTIAMTEGLPAEAPSRRGVASEKPFTVRALLHIIPGHVAYHLDHLRENYLGAKDWPK